MTVEQKELIKQAELSIQAARVLLKEGFPAYSASRSYYAMFYLAEAALLCKALVFSKHSAVHSSFGKELVKEGDIPPEYHKYLISGYVARHAADYGKMATIDRSHAELQILHAEQFYEFICDYLNTDE